MNLKQYCVNCGSKQSLYSVFTIEYQIKKAGKYQYSTHSNKTVFRLCKKCGNHSDFRLDEIIEKTGFYLACFVPEFKEQLKGLKGKQAPICVICSKNKDPPDQQKNTKNAIIKLYLDSSIPFGYFCRICERAYYLPIKKIKWQKHNSFKHSRIDLLNPLNKWYKHELLKVNRKLKSIREELKKGEIMPKLKQELKPHPRFNQDSGLIQWFMNLDSIGPFMTTKGAPTDEIENLHSVSIPKRKYQKIMKILRENNCTVLN